MSDRDFQDAVSRAMHELFPEPTDATPYMSVEHHRHRGRLTAVLAVVGVVVVGAVVLSLVRRGSDRDAASTTDRPSSGVRTSVSPSSPITSTGPTTQTESVSSSPTPVLPTWARACFRNDSDIIRSEPRYVGLNPDQAVRLGGHQVVYAGGGGKCSGVDDLVGRGSAIALFFDKDWQSGPYDPQKRATARVVAAVLAAPGWRPGLGRSRDH